MCQLLTPRDIVSTMPFMCSTSGRRKNPSLSIHIMSPARLSWHVESLSMVSSLVIAFGAGVEAMIDRQAPEE